MSGRSVIDHLNPWRVSPDSRSDATVRVRMEMEEAEPSPIVDRADFDPAYDPRAPIECEVCGAVMHYIAACKILCANCGYRRDCSDP